MSQVTDRVVSPVLTAFHIEGEILDSDLVERGHINRTYTSTVKKEGAVKRYVHQRINTYVFRDPEGLMGNVQRVLNHLATKNGDHPLRLVPTLEGAIYFVDEEHGFWRTYEFVEDTTVYDQVESPEVAYQAARSFGAFLNDLGDLDAAQLVDTIPNFHNTPHRVGTFRTTLAQASGERMQEAAAEIAFAQAHVGIADRLVRVMKEDPRARRVTHNDTKVNNVLFSAETGQGVCVIDLDTVMAGTVLYDVGDLLRTACNTGKEDDQDLTQVNHAYDHYEAVVSGFLDSLGDQLRPAEWDAIPYAGLVMTYQQMVRFLTDYLDGDRYFKIEYPEHNLVRARAQAKLFNEMMARLEDQQAFVKSRKIVLA
jgi:aminoglycoside phosphotransferase (APT) family kinase protein